MAATTAPGFLHAAPSASVRITLDVAAVAAASLVIQIGDNRMNLPISRRSALALVSSVALAPLAGCGKPAVTGPSADDAFKALGDKWLDGVARLNPTYATFLGDHRFDAELDDVSAAGRAARSAFSKEISDGLAAIDRAKLSRDNQVDAAMLSEQLEYDAFAEDQLQDWAWDPLTYSDTAGNSLYAVMAREFAPVNERLMSATSRMEKLPDMLAETRKQLVAERVPLIHAETYSKQNGGAISIIDDLILAQSAGLGPDDLTRLKAAAEKAKAAVQEHQTWIDTQLVPNAKGDFRLGALYDTKLRLSINSSIPRAELLAKARADAEAIRNEMYEIALNLAGNSPALKLMPKTTEPIMRQGTIMAAMKMASEHRPVREQLMADAKKTLAEATNYVRDHDLITLPDAPVQVIEMPKFQQGVAVAYCDSPGPLDRKLDTFYAISPIPAEWTDAQTQSFLSEYNSYMLYELSVHEAMPGHYVQLWHSNRNPSTLRAVLGSGPFIEGWACYAEDMMVEQGFGADDPFRRLTNLKMRLRTVTNAILDQGVHVEGWDEATAMKFMTEYALQEEREAAGKWTRARVSSGQLSTYFVGWTEHHALRKDWEAKQGAAFNLKAYHDAALSHGSPPGRFVRQLMFDEAIA
jgi:uncharacterized protein (DUF885 family)